MNILHLFGDWKWTGPAEPTLDLCLELQRRGCNALLACQSPPEGNRRSLLSEAHSRGSRPITLFALDKRPNFKNNIADIRRLRKFVAEHQVQLIHVHGSHDHFLGGIAARSCRRRPMIVRTNHRGVEMPGGPGAAFLLRELTDGYIGYSARALERDRERFALPENRTLLVNPAMQRERYLDFRPTGAARRKFGIEKDRFVVGIVARVQRHRRFDMLLRGFALARKEEPRLLLMVIGRGTHHEELAVRPARQLGIADHVLFPGYLADDYLETLAAFDAMIFIVPGSDGTCRALREGMAMGKPVIAARRGMIPEILGADPCGLLIDDQPEEIASAMIRLARDGKLCRSLGARARERASSGFSLERQAQAVLAFYERILH